MDAHQVASSHDAFDALLDASSLGAPRVQAVRRHTSATVRELLASRLAGRVLPVPGASGRGTSPSQRVTESASAQPPSQRPRTQPDLVHAPPERSRSRKLVQVRFDYAVNEKIGIIISPPCEAILRSVRELTEYLMAPAVQRVHAKWILPSFVHRPEDSYASAEESMKTGLFLQLIFSGEGGRWGSVGRYGMGLKIARASVFPSVEPWSFCNLAGEIFRNIEFLYASSDSRVRAHRQSPRERPPLDLFGGRRGVGTSFWREAMVHGCRSWANSLECWRDLRADVSGYPARGIGTQAGRGLARAMDHVLCTTTDHLTHLCSASWWLRTDHGTPLLSSFALSSRANQRGRSPAGPGTAGRGERYLWLDHFTFTVRPQGAPGDAHAALDGGQILYLSPAGPASVRCSGQTAGTYWSGVPAALEERQTLKRTCAAFGPGQEFSERWSTRQYAAWGRILAGDYSWPDYFMATPVHEMIMAIRAAGPLWNEPSESPPRNSPVPLPAALKLLHPAPAGGTAFSFHLNATLLYRIGETKKSTAVRAAAELTLHAGGTPVPVVLACRSDSPSIVHAVFEGLSGEQTGWTFARDPLVEEAKSS